MSCKMEGSNIRAYLAQKAYDESKDKQAAEKTIYVDESTFLACLTDKNEHHKGCIYNKGYLRTYHEPFFVKNPDGMGQTYHHGIVHIVNKDSPVNQVYELNSSYTKNFELTLSDAMKVKRHRLVSLTVDYETDNSIVAKLTPQRINFDD